TGALLLGLISLLAGWRSVVSLRELLPTVGKVTAARFTPEDLLAPVDRLELAESGPIEAALAAGQVEGAVEAPMSLEERVNRISHDLRELQELVVPPTLRRPDDA